MSSRVGNEEEGRLTYEVSTLDDWANARAAIGMVRRAEERIFVFMVVFGWSM